MCWFLQALLYVALVHFAIFQCLKKKVSSNAKKTAGSTFLPRNEYFLPKFWSAYFPPFSSIFPSWEESTHLWEKCTNSWERSARSNEIFMKINFSGQND